MPDGTDRITLVKGRKVNDRNKVYGTYSNLKCDFSSFLPHKE